jgi:hypothetical protein|tara:strand:- start:899 stop:1180 length:282 start_codon:yes stop_codon:yes gene_type:complete
MGPGIMIKRTFSCLVFLLFYLSPSFAEDLVGQAEQALSSGDSETALAIYMELLAASPGDMETVEIIVFLAEELALPSCRRRANTAGGIGNSGR